MEEKTYFLYSWVVLKCLTKCHRFSFEDPVHRSEPTPNAASLSAGKFHLFTYSLFVNFSENKSFIPAVLIRGIFVEGRRWRSCNFKTRPTSRHLIWITASVMNRRREMMYPFKSAARVQMGKTNQLYSTLFQNCLSWVRGWHSPPPTTTVIMPD